VKQLRIPIRMMNLYPPFVGAGIRVREVSADCERVVVEMKLTLVERERRTHFGGSRYIMIDPFYALMLMPQLGRGYIVRDREATIRFLAPGRSRVRAVFALPVTLLTDTGVTCKIATTLTLCCR
jgi:hypothetical protein